MPLYIAKSGDLDRCYRCLTHSHLKDRATQLLLKYKSGALVTQFGQNITAAVVYHFTCSLFIINMEILTS